LNQFSRRVGVEFFADTASMNKGFAEVGAATKQYATLSSEAQAKVTKSVLDGTATRIAATRASIAEFQLASETYVKGSDAQIAAAYQLGIAQKRLAMLTGETAVAQIAFSGKAKTAERDFGKTTRGILAGSGAFTSLGRSLAFASGGFLLFASGAALVRKSIDAARQFAVAQRQVTRQLQTSGKSWADYGARINEADLKLSHVSGFTNKDLLTAFTTLYRVTSNVGKALHLNSIAADVARGRNISLTAASNALAKAAAGSFSALRRLNIVIPKGATELQALAYVQRKYAGQAESGTTTTQRFSATLTNTEEIIGKALLPAVNRITREFGNWLSKMNETGRLQKDVAAVTKVLGAAFRALGDIIGAVDKVTGSFKHTLEILLGVYTVTKVTALAGAVGGLATKWGLVATAAGDAAAAQTAALGSGGAAAGGAAAARSGVVSRVSQYAPVGEGAAAGAASRRFLPGSADIAPLTIPAILLLTDTKVTANARKELHDFIHGSVGDGLKSGVSAGLAAAKRLGFLTANTLTTPFTGQLPIAGFKAIFGGGGGGGNAPPFSPAITRGSGVPSAFQFPFGSAGGGGAGGAKSPIQQWAAFKLTIAENVAQAQAALTKSTKDDVAAAKAIIARIKRIIAAGHLHGDALVQALQAEAGAIGTIQNAAAAEAAKRQAAAAKAQAAASTFELPAALQVAQARLQAYGGDQTKLLHQVIRIAEKAIKSGKKNWQGVIAALNVIGSARQQLATQTVANFQASAKLTLAIAKDQALGRSQTQDLLKLRKAILHFIATHKKNIAAVTDAYNQLYAVNQQLGQAATSALGGFKQASTRALTKGLGLTDAQRRALRARLSQLGPGGTIPGSGVGAAGFIIGTDGRPLIVHTHVNIDGKRVANNVTRHQQRHRRRNPHQRRGPNAGG
jgi:hypothetical protein